MSTPCIADAIPLLEELQANLDDAYWEASCISDKDRIYNLISAINQELSELSKLSVQDHNLSYEVVSAEFSLACQALSALQLSLKDTVLRTRTALRLAESLKSLAPLLH